MNLALIRFSRHLSQASEAFLRTGLDLLGPGMMLAVFELAILAYGFIVSIY